MKSKPHNHGQKVNLLILTTGLGIGGAEVVVRDLAQTVDRKRFNVTICCLKALGIIGQGLADAGVDICTLPGVDPARADFTLPHVHRARVDYLTSIKLHRVIRDKGIDVVHSHTTHALVDGILCKLATPGLKVVHTFHFGNYPHTSSRTLWMERVCSRFADRLVAVGEFQREQIRSVFRLRDGAVCAVLNGVRMPAPGEGDRELRSRVGADGKILVGTIATLIEQKGLRDLLSAARRVHAISDNVRFVAVGEGRLRAELERLRRDLGLEDTVVFYGWLRNAAALALPALDIYFQPSLWEAMSISILEAMAAGKAIVATGVGETPQVIEDQAQGLLFRPGDVNGMADAISRLAADPGLRRRLGNAASQMVAERFTVDHMSRAYEKLYLDVLQSGRSRVTHAAS